MTLFHGTPAKFNKFDLSKIGSGEGAQAFGYGLYFAESPGVARSYQAKLTQNISGDPDEVLPTVARYGDIEVDMRAASKDLTPEQRAVTSVVLNNDSPYLALEDLREWQVEPGIPDADEYRKAADWLEAEIHKGNPKLYEIEKDFGHLYEVEIPDETVAKMLDWDAPVEWESRFGQDIVEAAEESGLDVDDLKDIMGAPDSGYEGQAETGRSIYEWLSASLGGDDKASQWLANEGIPGIRFFDGSSRAKGEGTRNIVVFNPDDITQVKRDGEKVFEQGKDLLGR
jgi:hypothetical protein